MSSRVSHATDTVREKKKKRKRRALQLTATDRQAEHSASMAIARTFPIRISKGWSSSATRRRSIIQHPQKNIENVDDDRRRTTARPSLRVVIIARYKKGVSSNCISNVVSLSLLGVGAKHSHFFCIFWTQKKSEFLITLHSLFVRCCGVCTPRERERETQRSKSDGRNVSVSCAVRLWRGRRRARVRRRRRRRRRQPLGRAFTKGDQRKMHSFFIQKREEDAEEKKAARRAR